MPEDRDGVWRPAAEDMADAQVLRLARRIGLSDYDTLRRFSVARPADYWAGAIDFLGFRWSKRPVAFMDISAGREFPRWFLGGELNWVDTVLAFADDPDVADRPAVIAEREDGSVEVCSYAGLASRVRAFAGGLAARALGRGDRIGLLMENGLEATVSLLAVAALGAIVVPLFTGFGPDAVVSRLEACGARALIASTGYQRRGKRIDFAAVVAESLPRLPALETVIWKAGDGVVPEGGVAWSEVAQGPPMQPARMGPDDPFMVIYTSGTTGKPKGTVHVHAGFPLKVAQDAAVHFDLGRGDRLCWPADMGWIAGAIVLAAALMRGAALVTYDGAPDFPDWSRMSRLVERHRVTHLGSSPTLIRGLAASAPLSTAGDVSSMRIMITAGEVIDPEHFLWFTRNFGRGERPLINYSGGTETAGGLVGSVIVKPIRPAGFNSFCPAIDVAVVDPQGRRIEEGTGELAVMAPFVGMTRSFWNDDERYLAAYWRTIPGIWVHGDLAQRLADGHVFLLGRSDDTLKLAGKRVGPAEVEDVLLEAPEFAEVAAIGVDDPAKGQKLVVFVAPPRGWTGDPAALGQRACERLETRLGKPFRPGAVHVVAALPRTRTTKVMRRLIRALYCGLPLGDLTALENPDALDEIRRAAAGDQNPRAPTGPA